MSREGQHAPRGGSFAHGPERATEIAASTDGGLLLVSSIDVPKCPKNLRLGPDSDSDDCGTGRKSSRRLSRGNTSRLSARFRSAALLAAASNLQSHRALGPLIGSTSPPATNRPQTRTHEMTSSQQHFATRKSSPLPQQQQSPPPRPQTRGRSPPSLTHRRSVSPAVGVLPPSLGMHSALSNPTYERCKQSFPKRTIQFR
jgi:hypothetical protein